LGKIKTLHPQKHSDSYYSAHVKFKLSLGIF